MPPDNTPDAKDPLEGCTRLTIVVWGAIVAPIAAGLALGTAVVVGGEVLFDAFRFQRGVNVELAILFVRVCGLWLDRASFVVSAMVTCLRATPAPVDDPLVEARSEMMSAVGHYEAGMDRLRYLCRGSASLAGAIDRLERATASMVRSFRTNHRVQQMAAIGRNMRE